MGRCGGGGRGGGGRGGVFLRWFHVHRCVFSAGVAAGVREYGRGDRSSIEHVVQDS